MSPGARDVDDELEPDESDDGVDGAGGDESADDDADDDAEEDDDEVVTGTRSPRRAVRRVADEGSYVCGSCGEEIVVPLDRTGGEQQEYVEDCPVCCSANVIRVALDGDRGVAVSVEAE